MQDQLAESIHQLEQQTDVVDIKETVDHCEPVCPVSSLHGLLYPVR